MLRKLATAAALLALAGTTTAQTPQTTPPPPPPTVTMPAEIQPPAPPPAAATPAPAAAPAYAPPPAEPAPVTTPAPAAAPPPAQQPPPPAPAAQAKPPPQEEKQGIRSKIYTWGSVGATFAYGNTYGNLNLGAGYLMKHGLMPNAEASYNFGASPTFWTLRPGVTWFLPVPRLHPYVGAYYTHWFVSSGGDQNGVGGRAGFSMGPVSLGVTYDRAFNCSKNCDVWTPIVGAGVSM